MFDYTKKNVVYVGGFSGIGYITCQKLMQKPIKYLIVCSRMENVEMLKKLQAINTSTKVMFVQMNVADFSSIERAVKQIVGVVGNIDVLINGVGVVGDKDVETTINVNLTGLINTTFLMLPYMDKQQSGHGGMVVNIASVYGLEAGPAFSVYCAAKHGVVGFTKSMSSDYFYRKTGIAFLCICPGMTSTELMFNKRDMTWMKWMPYQEEMYQTMTQGETQAPEICAKNMLQIMDEFKNGGVYICSMGDIKEVKPTTYLNV